MEVCMTRCPPGFRYFLNNILLNLYVYLVFFLSVIYVLLYLSLSYFLFLYLTVINNCCNHCEDDCPVKLRVFREVMFVYSLLFKLKLFL